MKLGPMVRENYVLKTKFPIDYKLANMNVTTREQKMLKIRINTYSRLMHAVLCQKKKMETTYLYFILVFGKYILKLVMIICPHVAAMFIYKHGDWSQTIEGLALERSEHHFLLSTLSTNESAPFCDNDIIIYSVSSPSLTAP